MLDKEKSTKCWLGREILSQKTNKQNHRVLRTNPKLKAPQRSRGKDIIAVCLHTYTWESGREDNGQVAELPSNSRS